MKHIDEIRGLMGFIITMIFPSLTSIEISLRIIGALFGLVLLVYSIIHKHLQVKYEKQKIKNLNDEKHGN